MTTSTPLPTFRDQHKGSVYVGQRTFIREPGHCLAGCQRRSIDDLIGQTIPRARRKRFRGQPH